MKASNFLVEHHDGKLVETNYLRGARKYSERPKKIYLNNPDNPQDMVEALSVVDPKKGEVMSRHKVLEEYLVLGDRLEQLYQDRMTKEKLYADTNEFMVTYNPILDERVIDKKTAMEEYPEAFI